MLFQLIYFEKKDIKNRFTLQIAHQTSIVTNNNIRVQNEQIYLKLH